MVSITTAGRSRKLSHSKPLYKVFSDKLSCAIHSVYSYCIFVSRVGHIKLCISCYYQPARLVTYFWIPGIFLTRPTARKTRKEIQLKALIIHQFIIDYGCFRFMKNCILLRTYLCAIIVQFRNQTKLYSNCFSIGTLTFSTDIGTLILNFFDSCSTGVLICSYSYVHVLMLTRTLLAFVIYFYF